jgi:two-component system OmpR family sensor kinase
MIRETRRAGRLVDDLLTTARLGQGEVRLAFERVDLARLTLHEVSRAQMLAPAVTFTVVPDAASVHGDPLRLGQILTNLLDNARHATPAGGTVTVSVRRAGERVLLEVADTGSGVPAAERALIFERFGRGDASRSRNTGGAGLGLPIARGLARAHGGDLTYVDSPAGATFRVDLPATT